MPAGRPRPSTLRPWVSTRSHSATSARSDEPRSRRWPRPLPPEPGARPAGMTSPDASPSLASGLLFSIPVGRQLAEQLALPAHAQDEGQPDRDNGHGIEHERNRRMEQDGRIPLADGEGATELLFGHGPQDQPDHDRGDGIAEAAQDIAEHAE